MTYPLRPTIPAIRIGEVKLFLFFVFLSIDLFQILSSSFEAQMPFFRYLLKMCQPERTVFRRAHVWYISAWSYHREVWCNPAGNEISNPGLNSTIVALHYLFITYIIFSLYLGTYARAFLFCARAIFINLIDNVLILLCIIFLTHIYVLSVTVLTLWVAPPEMFYSWYRI